MIYSVENNLITNHVKQMLLKNFDTLIDENCLNAITLMYNLFLRIGSIGITSLREAFSNYIKVIQIKKRKEDISFFFLFPKFCF